MTTFFLFVWCFDRQVHLFRCLRIFLFWFCYNCVSFVFIRIPLDSFFFFFFFFFFTRQGLSVSSSRVQGLKVYTTKLIKNKTKQTTPPLKNNQSNQSKKQIRRGWKDSSVVNNTCLQVTRVQSPAPTSGNSQLQLPGL